MKTKWYIELVLSRVPSASLLNLILICNYVLQIYNKVVYYKEEYILIISKMTYRMYRFFFEKFGGH